MRFGIDVEEMINKEDRNEEEEKFLQYYSRKMPVFLNKSTMNRICWRIENEFNDYKSNKEIVKFDYKRLMSGDVVRSKIYNSIKTLYEEYTARVRQYSQTFSTNKSNKEEKPKY